MDEIEKDEHGLIKDMADRSAFLTAIYWHRLVMEGLTRKEATKITVAWVASMGGKGEGEASE